MKIAERSKKKEPLYADQDNLKTLVGMTFLDCSICQARYSIDLRINILITIQDRISTERKLAG